MAIDLVLCLESFQCRPYNRWWLVQEPCCVEALVLYRLAEVILEHTTLPISRLTDHDVAKTDIVLLAWRTAADAHHQTDPDVREAA